MKRMKLIVCVLSMTLVGILLLSTVSSNGQDEQEKEPWKGKLKDGTVINKEDLSKILEEHKKWIETRKKEGQRANLSDASLSGANLSKANLSEANLCGAHLSNANLSEANLSGADLSDANMQEVKLKGADLHMSTMRGAIFTWTELCMAKLDNSKLKDDLVWGVSLISVEGKRISKQLKDLARFMYESGQQSILVLFRSSFKETGQRNLEREATYAIEYGRTYNTPWYVKWVKIILFEWTCGYGLDYLRPLAILLGLIVVFSIPYIVSLESSGNTGIWIVWSKERLREKKAEEGKDKDKDEPKLIKELRGPRVLGYAFYFSLLTAFHIGWRDLNVGSWIARMQPNEYVLKSNGWVRFVSGVQSLISIYLLALWVLTQFGRPFD